MAQKNFNDCFDFTIRYEGGYVNHPKDPGGPTNLGITQKTLSNHLGKPASIADVKALTKSSVMPIYRKRYWDAVKGNLLPYGLDLVVWDYGVNSGPGRAIKALQKIVGEKQDGIIGADTLTAVKEADVEKLIKDYTAERLRFLKRLGTWRTFGKGWKTRVDAAQKLALSMATKGAASSVDVEVEISKPVSLLTPRADENQVSVAKTTTGKANIVAGLGAAGAAATEAAGQLAPLSDTLEVVKYVFVFLTLVGVAATMYMAFIKPKSQDED